MAAKQAKVSAAAELALRWSNDPRWQGISRPYSAEDVVALRGRFPVEHTLARLGAERLWELLHADEPDPALGAVTGGQAVQMVRAGLKAIYLSGWQVAADANLVGPDLSRPEPLSGEQRPGARAAAQQRAAARRPDRRGRGARRHPLVRADRRRRRGRLRRPAQRLRADEGDDRGGRRRASTSRISSRPRRSAATSAARCSSRRASSSARSSPRGSPPTCSTCRRCSSRAPTRSARRCSRATSTRSTSRSSPASARPRASSACATASRPRSRGRSPTRRTPTCSGSRPRRRTSARRASSPRRSTRQFPGKLLAYNCSPSFNWKRHLDDAEIASFRETLGRARATGSSSSRSPASTRSTRRCSSWRATSRPSGMTAYVELQEREFALEDDGLHRDTPPARGRRRLLRPRRRDRQRRRVLDARAARLDRGRAVRVRSRLSGARRVEVHAPGDREILSPEALALRRATPRRAERRPARAARAAARARQRELDAGRAPGVRARGRRRRRLAGRAGAARPARPALRDHRPGRPQDDDQRAQLRRPGLHVRLRGRVLADLDERRRGPAQPARRGAAARSRSRRPTRATR